MADDVALDLAPQRAGGDGEGHVDHDVAPSTGRPADHAQVDDGVAQLGVDHGAQAVAHFVLALGSGRVAPERRVGVGSGPGGHVDDSTCVAPDFRPGPCPVVCRAARPPVTWMRRGTAPRATARAGRQGRRNEEDQ